MNMINKALTISASAFLMTASQITLADSLGETFPESSAEALGVPTITIIGTPNSVKLTATVSYVKENLESEEGVREIYKLLQRASKDVCSGGSLQHQRNVIMKSSQVRCYRQALSSAVSRIDDEELTRIHTG